MLFDLFRQKGLNVPTDNSFDLLNVKSRAVDFILRPEKVAISKSTRVLSSLRGRTLFYELVEAI